MEKTSRDKTPRLTLRHPKIAEAFSRRFRQAIAETGCSQRDLAKKLGGFRNDTISRLCRGQATTIPIDLFIRITEWSDVSGISLRWLFLGLGPMKKSEMPAVPDAVESINQAAVIRLIAAFAKRQGIDLTDVLKDTPVAAFLPEWGIGTFTADEVVKAKTVKRKRQ